MKRIYMFVVAAMLATIAMAQENTIYGFSMSSPYALLKFTADNPAGAVRVGSTNIDPRSGAAVGDDLYVIGVNDDFDPVLYKAKVSHP